jgi:Ca2+-binding EF-hand superfamily protein
MPKDFTADMQMETRAAKPAAATTPSGGGASGGDSARAQSAEVRAGGGSKETFLDGLFARIDKSGDGGIDHKEVVAHLKNIGVKGGFLGMVHKGAADAFLEHLDTNKDGRVTMKEFRAVAQQLLPKDVFDDKGQVKPDLIDEAYKRMDANQDGKVGGKEMAKAAKAEMPEDTSFKDTKADVASKLALDALDFDHSGGITRAELLQAAEDAAQALRGA